MPAKIALDLVSELAILAQVLSDITRYAFLGLKDTEMAFTEDICL